MPTWDPKFGPNPLATEVTARLVQFVGRIASTPPFAQKLKAGGARVPDIKAESLENAIDIVRQSEIGVFHPCGSCNKGSVADTNLRVYGVRGLRVVDASFFPLVPVGNIQSVVYAAAEKAADVVMAERRQIVARGLGDRNTPEWEELHSYVGLR
ncbi:unnamed protein product [Clonostachys rosea f. rosea IK726]|uniref:Glucose-methanol-choline oxidoreductase C-terminal domain-containing protein n=2 Tax=Bionectria ochroleuca TaxID=29856 RepID=A0A0B7K5Y1_BIOOC|nr:unnamed protein product [Clonostachys rosea f. rosea IK726]